MDEWKNPDKWIPCAEDLPKETGFYWTTRQVTETRRAVMQGCFEADQKTWANANNVIAWRPIPQPYMGM